MASIPLLVGEANPYGGDPRFALYPAPDGCSGHRLATLIFGLHRQTYLDAFERVNLCPCDWSTKEARSRASGIAAARPAGSWTILCGAKVARSFGMAPASAAAPALVGVDAASVGWIVIPHPSGLCRIWNADVIRRVRAALAEVLPAIPFGEARP
jgi:hypothetical protein